jgi:hypothetical protein
VTGQRPLRWTAGPKVLLAFNLVSAELKV